MWAFNLPCMLLVNDGQAYWSLRLKDVFKLLYKDMLLSVRKSIAAGLIEVAKLIDLVDEKYASENQTFLIEVINHFMTDIEEVKAKVVGNICQLVSLFPEEPQ